VVLDDIDPSGTTTRVRWEGEIDIATVRDFEGALDAATTKGGDVLIDLRDTTFIDSTGISVLAKAAITASERCSTVEVLAEQPMMRRAFALMNLDLLMSFDPPLERPDGWDDRSDTAATLGQPGRSAHP